MHVRDLDAVDRSDRGPERERGARIVGVDVNLESRRVADDEQRVAEPVEPCLERLAIEALSLDDEHRAVPEARELLVYRVDAEAFRRHRRFGNRLARDDRRHATHDLEQARPARVDDARVAEDVELLLRQLDRALPALDERVEQLARKEIRRRPRLRFLREGADHRQHRPLDRTAYRAIRGV